MNHFTHFELPTRQRRRCAVVLSEGTFSELSQLAEQWQQRPGEVVQTALDLLKVARDAAFRGQVLAIATRGGELLKEIVIPG